MKKYLLVLTCLLLMSCGHQAKEKPESKVANQSVDVVSVYDQLLSDYQKAAQTSLDEVDNPLLNPVSLAAARAYTGEGELDIVSKTFDLNHDGQEELLIGTQSSSGDGTVTIYTGAYGQIDGEVVDLLKTILPADSDAFLTFYTNNRLRLDYVTSNIGIGNAVYELTDQGFKEMLVLEKDMSAELDASGNYPIKDKQGQTYKVDELEGLITEALGHAWDQEVID